MRRGKLRFAFTFRSKPKVDHRRRIAEEAEYAVRPLVESRGRWRPRSVDAGLGGPDHVVGRVRARGGIHIGMTKARAAATWAREDPSRCRSPCRQARSVSVVSCCSLYAVSRIWRRIFRARSQTSMA